MRIVSFRHKGLQQFYESGKPKGGAARDGGQTAEASLRDRDRSLLGELSRFPGWKLHPLKGGLKGFWSLTVTGNWRLIFRCHEEAKAVVDIDLVDYH
jgi:proteic killer suppression protein